MNEFDFHHQIAVSDAATASTKETLQRLLGGDYRIEKVDGCNRLNKLGVDYIAANPNGAVLWIEHKLRVAGCSGFWERTPDGKLIPELALEVWSVKDTVPGWTLDWKKTTDFVLFTFDPSDLNVAFFLPYQLLRIAFHRNLEDWKSRYMKAVQRSGSWHSECLFVPYVDVRTAMTECQVDVIK